MTLKKYQSKRDFRKTKEPKGEKKKGGKDLIFVVQKHDASQLHYDFRLELDGVLKSWAVPKGPSMNPNEKRLAIMVEDHPLDYKDFEGVIPKENYGGGTVIVWDNGIYHSIEHKNKDEDEKLIKKGLTDGDIKFILEGQKLKGKFALVNMKKPKENAWLLIKKKDKFSSTKDILNKDTSVLSGNKIEEVEEIHQKEN
jgi:bifunctional non-homologous end joining protein LigD